MARKKKEASVGRSIGVLFLYLVIWWIFLTLTNEMLGLHDGKILYHILNFLRVAVPISVVLFGVPIILIVDSNKMKTKKVTKRKSK